MPVENNEPMSFLRTLLAFSLLFQGQGGHSQSSQSLKQEVDKVLYLDSKVDFERSPGISIALFIGDSTYTFHYGRADRAAATAPTDTTLYELGEVTQLFTAVLIHRLAGQGLLELEGAFGKYLSVPDSSLAHLSVRQCLRHRSGLPRLPEGFGERIVDPDNPYGNYSTQTFLTQLTAPVLHSGEPATYRFSNLNYALLGALAAQRQGQTYDRLLRDQVLDPLGLSWTHLQEDSAFLRFYAAGYDKSGKQTARWQLEAFEPALGLRSNLLDLIRFCRLFLQQSPLAGFTAEEMMEDPQPTNVEKNFYVGDGWHLRRLKKYYPVWLHTGATSGCRAYVALVPQTRTGVIVLSNSPYGLGGLGWQLLRMLNHDWKKRGNR